MRLLDTDVLIDISKNVPQAVAWFTAITQTDPPGLPGFTALEFLKGARTKAELARYRMLLVPFAVYWPTAADCARAVETCAQTSLTHNLSIPDLMIAECAIGLGATLCTFNVRHFRVVTGLVTEQPYPRS
jgi:predicted nucleic acid-binding protein